jgi:two-component system phosphate regulon response regulator PhoB
MVLISYAGGHMTHTERRILIVEDEPLVAGILAKILDGAGAHVVTAGTVKDAGDLLDKETFDIVILDRMLPDGDGVQLFNKIKGTPALSHLPVLILSGKDDPQEQAEGLDLGADDYMTKPFAPEELRARVTALLRRAGKFR